ncbi:MAG: peptidoglycan bridge formation glycyltransferase FemA/FemB family protein [Candidatus Andersenbacteria bacterium]|nr:peptidoglycan bridge formation glycyltransferase FemA/FemB family protein [bacterium]MDZ4225802.1 peptidoglycan bridge formation glycyltransferase FemA/FemB family protein [Candidatus Andersenbacteria bacterium]
MIQEITDRNQWTSFLLTLSPNTFLQTWQWGEVQNKSGENIIRLGIFNDNQLIGLAQIIIVNARRGRHYLIPHGPAFLSEEQTLKYLPAIISYLKSRARQDRVLALRLAPLLINSQTNRDTLKQLGFKPAPLHIHSELTWILDINLPAETLLANMRKTSRQAINKAEKMGVTCFVITDQSAIDHFAPLYQVTTVRHGFVPFSIDSIREEFQQFSGTKSAYAVIASYQGKDIAAGIFIQCGNKVFYHHGASIKVSKIPGAQLLQWHSILEAQKRGAELYNFWGIAPDDKPHHPFAGITVFKKGFGGRAIDYLHAHDLPLSWRYRQLWAIDYWRKIRRGF